MSDRQIPSVTLTDLQSFQAKHFPGSEPPAAFTPLEPAVVDDSTYNDEEDLGYYPDGVKRTLTDEQIEIFRHSEIHSLLRERQLREENRSEDEEEVADLHEPAHSAAESKPASAAVSEFSAKKRPLASADTALDYDEQPTGPTGVKRGLPAGHNPRYTGRRIISYDD
ncbi:hypothetical protein P168DRAFT_315487 [Aspergillus campestris IBT 28561]|uniref:Uncharacterized protein n=1 Tax=Aspergillus campestris (strain IBT 28561) TaxID=1392248 RepID=A0A2I1DAQ0_ASPC2|nr:uncharacterized protein P168DRAFT_315487 [Aspergillus campestris IBT 28561]PKY06956.1 hypothetical protein P168DRAFT_315487 [Aspergillus campestris IBT 28561]